MKKEKTDNGQFEKMTQTPISRLTIALGIPAVITMLVSTVYNMVDTWFVAKLGVQAVGAVGISFALMEFISSIGYLFGMGSGANIGRLLGANRKEEAGAFGSTAFFAVMALSITAALAGMAGIVPLMRFLGASETILGQAVQYGRLILIGFPMMAGSLVLSTILRCEGKMKQSMLGMGSGALLNIVLDPLLIFGAGMGVSGAALATVISQTIGMAILLSFYVSGKTDTKLSLHLIRMEVQMFRTILVTGLPSLCRHLVATAATICVNVAAGLYGGDVLIACLSIVNKLTAVIMAVIKGFGQGSQAIFSYNCGAKRFDRVKRAYCFGTGFNMLLMLGAAVTVWVFAEPIMKAFSTDGGEVVTVGTTALRFQMVGLVLMPFNFSVNMLLQAVGKPMQSTFLAALPQGIVYIPALFLLPVIWGVNGVLIAPAVGQVLTAVISLPFVTGYMRSIRGKGKEAVTGAER